MARFCDQSRSDWPWAGNVPISRSRKRESPELATMRRRAWLAGWDAQDQLMKSDAMEETKKAAPDEAALWDQLP